MERKMTKKKLRKRDELELKIFKMISDTLDDSRLLQKWFVDQYGTYNLNRNDAYIEVKADVIFLKEKKSTNKSTVSRVLKNERNEKVFEELISKIDTVFYQRGLDTIEQLTAE
jgi:hypothetical protein